MSLKDLIEEDVDIFLDVVEFAELHTVELEKEEYSIPVTIEKNVINQYKKQWDGVYQTSLTVFFKESNVKRKPVKDQILKLDGKSYVVAKCDAELGMLEVCIEVPET